MIGPFDTWQEGLQKVWAQVRQDFNDLLDGMGKALEAWLKSWKLDNLAGFKQINDFADRGDAFLSKITGGLTGDAVFAGGAASPAAAAERWSHGYDDDAFSQPASAKQRRAAGLPGTEADVYGRALFHTEVTVHANVRDGHELGKKIKEGMDAEHRRAAAAAGS